MKPPYLDAFATLDNLANSFGFADGFARPADTPPFTARRLTALNHLPKWVQYLAANLWLDITINDYKRNGYSLEGMLGDATAACRLGQTIGEYAERVLFGTVSMRWDMAATPGIPSRSIDRPAWAWAGVKPIWRDLLCDYLSALPPHEISTEAKLSKETITVDENPTGRMMAPSYDLAQTVMTQWPVIDKQADADFERFRTQTAVALADRILETWDGSTQPLLADALEDAGYNDQFGLNTLRQNPSSFFLSYEVWRTASFRAAANTVQLVHRMSRFPAKPRDGMLLDLLDDLHSYFRLDPKATAGPRKENT